MLLGLFGLGLGVAVAAMRRNAEMLGFQFTPLVLDQTASVLTFLVLPAALAAGVAVAEITVAGTVAAARQAQRLSRHRWPYVLLALLVALRLIQTGVQIADLDPVEEGWLALAPAAGHRRGVRAITWLLVKLARAADGLGVAELPDDVARIGIPVGVAMTCVLLPVLAFLFAYQILFALDPTKPPRPLGFDPSPLVDRVTDVLRRCSVWCLIAIAAFGWRAAGG